MATKKTKTALFTKEQLLQSDRFKHEVDLLNALLDPGKLYSRDEVDMIIKKHMKGKVR